MSRHSKWSKIKRAKGAADIKKGAVFTKLGNAITVAVKEGGGDPAMNFKLRLAIDRARAANMPKETIDRAIQRGVGSGNEAALEELTYEGFAPGGAAVIVTALTDNRNRTLGEVKRVFSEYGGTLGGQSSVAWMFQKRGVLRLIGDKEMIELAAIDAGAEDIQEEDDRVVVFTALADLQTVKHALEAQRLTIEDADSEWVAKDPLPIQEEKKEQLVTFLEALDDLDDVQGVYTNAGI